MFKLFPWKRALRDKTVWFSLLVMLLLGSAAALASSIAPRHSIHDPYRGDFTQSGLPPMWVQDRANPGRAEFPLGTDRYGRDILSRLLYGTRTALLLAFTAVPLAALIGTLVGLISGYAGGRIDQALMFLTELLLSLPGIMFLVIIVLIFRSFLSPTWFHGVITLGVGFAAVSWVSLARLIRVNVLQIKSLPFVEAAIALGASPQRIILNHLLPNLLHVILVWVINNVPAVILIEALLGYLGINVVEAVEGGEFTVISWGGIFFSGRSALNSNPLMLAIPSLCILLISMSFFLLGDFLNSISRQE